MGWGDFGSNGSVHWQIGYSNNPNDAADHKDYDDIPYDEVGAARKHKGHFRVTARFASNAEAQKALAEAQARLAETGNVIELDVRLRPRQSQPGPNDRWEIRVDW